MTAEEIKVKMLGIAQSIGAPEYLLPLVGEDTLEGSYIEIEGKYAVTYRLVVKERGQEIDFSIAPTIDDLMYAVFSRVAFQLAINWELDNRIEGEDFRRQTFAKQLEILNKISPLYAEKERVEINRILKYRPYKD